MGLGYLGISSFLLFSYCSRAHSTVFAGEEMKMSRNGVTPTIRTLTSARCLLGFGPFALLALMLVTSNAYARTA